MKKTLLLEGAIAGHMNHVYDNGEMSFAELRQLVAAAANGKLRGTEKTDGQNIYISFNVKTNRAVGIRNKTMIAAGGFDRDKMDVWFADHVSQAIRHSFVEAIDQFERSIVSLNLSEDEKIQIFGPGVEYTYEISDVKKYTTWHKTYRTVRDSIKDPKGRAKKARNETEQKLGPEPELRSRGTLNYFNTEVMNPGSTDFSQDDPRGKGTTNVIPYDKKTLLFHRVGHHSYTTSPGVSKGIVTGDIVKDSSFRRLESSIADLSTDDKNVFSIEANPIRTLPGIKDKKIEQETIQKIDNLLSDSGMNPASTINQYVISQLGPQIDKLNVSEPLKDLILMRIMKMEDEESGEVPSLKDIKKHIPPETSGQVDDFVNNFNYSNYTSAIEMAMHDFSVSMIDGLKSSFISDNDAAIFNLQKMASDYKETIENSSNEEAKRGLEKQWSKLKHVKNINTASEGFVFDFNEVTYKFTGAFAPLNQIIGIRKYGRYGPIGDEGEETDMENEQENISESKTIAIFPGSFKPPHMGHLRALLSISQEADVIYVLISKPQLSTRALPVSGKSIDADQAKQCWHAMLDKTNIKDKTRVMISDHASPITTTVDFVTHPADPNNIFVAPPNCTVVLGVGNKDSDAKRFNDKLINDAKRKRPDLKIVTKAVGPFTHDPQYLSILKNNPTIAQELNKGKGRISSDQLSDEEKIEGKIADRNLYHASDMRYFMDLASENPIGLEILRYFVPSIEDAIAFLGIIGINPADKEKEEIKDPKEDPQNIFEHILYTEAAILLEKFKKQKAPRGRPDSGKFQRKMRKRLSKAHKTYLDTGRRDLTKHGGGFHLDRPKDVSNAFLAEEEIEEMSSMAAGSVQGHSSNRKKENIIKREDKKMTKQEKRLRLKIRKGLKNFLEAKSKQDEKIVFSVLEEHRLRLKLRNIILEQSLLLEVEDPTTDVHDSTGINTLKDLFKNTNILSTLRNVYKTLTTDEDQKMSFRAHVVQWAKDTLAPIKLNDTDSVQSTQVTEQSDVGIDVLGVNDEDRKKFIDVSDGSEKDPEISAAKEEEDSLSKLSGQDTTGRNKAERIYPTIEKSIVDYYAELDNADDQEMFYDYLIANIKLYFDKWDNESSKSIEEPTNDAYSQAKGQEAPQI